MKEEENAVKIAKDWWDKRRIWLVEHEAQLDDLCQLLDDQRVHELLVARRWRWASSALYQTPVAAHSYTIRELRPDDVEFEALLRWVGDPLRSASRRFGSRVYREWTDPFEWPGISSRFFGLVDRWFFWSMCPIEMPAARHSQYASVLNRNPWWPWNYAQPVASEKGSRACCEATPIEPVE